jgi:Mrp family chromosome partitioning ATPase
MFDIVFVDTPPLLSVTDALEVAGQCDGALLVLRAGKVSPDAALKAKACLARSNTTLIGAVLNGAGR